MKPSHLKILSFFTGAFNRKFQVDERIFNVCCAKWFQTSHDRLKYAKKQKKIEIFVYFKFQINCFPL